MWDKTEMVLEQIITAREMNWSIVPYKENS
jgi:hypothetical protein